MNVSQDRLDWLLHSCNQIIDSKKILQFVVGISGNPIVRRNAYRRWAAKKGGKLDGFVVLEWNQNPEDVVQIERFLFANLVNEKRERYGVIKMHYYPNVNRRFDSQVVYLAWWSPWLVYTK